MVNLVYVAFTALRSVADSLARSHCSSSFQSSRKIRFFIRLIGPPFLRTTVKACDKILPSTLDVCLSFLALRSFESVFQRPCGLALACV